MSKKSIYVTIEPAEATPIWFSRVLEGIKSCCLQKRVTMNLLSIDQGELDTLEELPEVLLVISSNIDWTTHAIHLLQSRGIAPLLIGSDPNRFGNDVSGIYLNRYKLIESFIKYFVTNGRFSIALLGLNPRSDNDLTKMDAFLRTSVSMDMSLSAHDIFWLDTDFVGPIQACLDSPSHYDGVICANDYMAIALMAEARKRGIRIPEDLFVAGMGHTEIGEFCTPSLTSTSSDDFSEMGRQAFLAADSISANSKLSRVSIAVDNSIVPRGSTAFLPLELNETELSPITIPTITAGKVSKEVRNLENMFQQSDDKDLEIIEYILRGKTNEQIEEQLYLAHSSLFYRQKRLYQLSRTQSKAELIALIQKYLPDYLETSKAYCESRKNQ